MKNEVWSGPGAAPARLGARHFFLRVPAMIDRGPSIFEVFMVVYCVSFFAPTYCCIFRAPSKTPYRARHTNRPHAKCNHPPRHSA